MHYINCDRLITPDDRSPMNTAAFSFLLRDNLWFRRRLAHDTERRMQRAVDCRTDVCLEKICTDCRVGGVRLDVVETRGGGGAGDGAGGPLDHPKVCPNFYASSLNQKTAHSQVITARLETENLHLTYWPTTAQGGHDISGMSPARCSRLHDKQKNHAELRQ